MINTTEYLLIQKRKLELRRQRLELAKRWGASFYKPHRIQDEFHKAGLQYKYRMVRAGNRTGKSEAHAAENTAWLLGERLWYPENHPARRGGIPQKPNKILCLAEDWDLVHELWTDMNSVPGGKIWKFIPKDGFVKSVARQPGSRAVCEIICANNSILRFDTQKAYLNNPRGAESKDWDGIGVDEPCVKEMFDAHSRGLIDRGGSYWFLLTPLSQAWINDLFFPQDTGGKPRSDVWAITGSIFDNPYISEAGRDEFLSRLTEEEKQCRAYGIPLHLAGLIYKQFDWNRHVLKSLPKGWKSWHEPPEDYTIYVAIDPHPQTPHAVLFCAVDPMNRRYYYYDIFDHCKISQLCGSIKRILGSRRTVSIRIDPSADIPDPVTELTMMNEFWRCGIPVEKSSKALSEGIIKVQGQLSLNDPQMIYFTPACARTLWEIQRYSWDPKRADKPVDKDDHTMECLYRIEIQDPRWVDPKYANEPLSELEITRPEIYDRDIDFSYNDMESLEENITNLSL